MELEVSALLSQVDSHLFLSWTRSIRSTPSQPIYWISILILFSHLSLDLLSSLFPAVFSTKTRQATDDNLTYAHCRLDT